MDFQFIPSTREKAAAAAAAGDDLHKAPTTIPELVLFHCFPLSFTATLVHHPPTTLGLNVNGQTRNTRNTMTTTTSWPFAKSRPFVPSHPLILVLGVYLDNDDVLRIRGINE